MGKSYAEQLVDNYSTCLLEQDKNMIHKYDKLFLSKVVADKVEMEVTGLEDALETKKLAFAEALAALTNKDTE